jgi:hypothetical protein
MAKAKTDKAVPGLNTKKDSDNRLVLLGKDYELHKTVTIEHKDAAGKVCTWKGKIGVVSHKKKYAVAVELKATPDDGYKHPNDDDAKPKGTDEVSVTVTDADPPTAKVKVDLYTE